MLSEESYHERANPPRHAHAEDAERAPPGRRRRRTGTADSPSPYLRRWLGHQAARHRDLLLNIDAASRIVLDPVRATR